MANRRPVLISKARIKCAGSSGVCIGTFTTKLNVIKHPNIPTNMVSCFKSEYFHNILIIQNINNKIRHHTSKISFLFALCIIYWNLNE